MAKPNLKAVVADDNPDILDLHQIVLEDAGFKVLAFGDGRPAFDYLNSNPAPQLLLTDMIMREMHGHELIAYLVDRRKADPRYAVPTLIVTGGGTPKDEFDAAVTNAVALYNQEDLAVLERKIGEAGIGSIRDFVVVNKPFDLGDVSKRATLIKSLYE